MSTPFPGMDPYLERRGLWEGVHTRLLVALADDDADWAASLLAQHPNAVPSRPPQ